MKTSSGHDVATIGSFCRRHKIPNQTNPRSHVELEVFFGCPVVGMPPHALGCFSIPREGPTLFSHCNLGLACISSRLQETRLSHAHQQVSTHPSTGPNSPTCILDSTRMPRLSHHGHSATYWRAPPTQCTTSTLVMQVGKLPTMHPRSPSSMTTNNSTWPMFTWH